MISCVDIKMVPFRRRAQTFRLLLALFAGGCLCSPPGPPLDGLVLGSSLEPDGSMADESLAYTFRPFLKKGTNRDLFNHIYFQGDTVCFSVRTSRPVAKSAVRAWFVDPESGRRFPAERLDVEGKRISGFSLVGSLLGSFFEGIRDKPAPKGHLNGVSVPFELIVTMADESGEHSVSVKSSFVIRYAIMNESKGDGRS